MTDHGAGTIKDWMQGLIETARSGKDFETSAGAEPGRAYSYLEYHGSDGSHSALVFAVEQQHQRPIVKAYRFDGSGDEVREAIKRAVPDEDRPAR